ncbi:hypothetical protein V6N13_025493 [Hibiscus sabdariffa]
MTAASMVVAAGFKFTFPPEPEPVLEDQDISKQCCVELVHEFGRSCHEDLLWFYISQPNLGVSATHVFTKGPQVWNSCFLRTEAKI